MSHRKKASRRPNSRRPAQRPGQREPSPLDGIGRALSGQDPLEFLVVVSGFLNLFDPRSADPFEKKAPGPALAEYVPRLLASPNRQTWGMLAGIAAMTTDDLLATRINRELASRPIPLPDWVVGLRTVTVDRVISVVDPLRDGEQLLLGVRLPFGTAITASLYVDYNLGTVVKDAFVMSAPVDEVLDIVQKHIGMDEDVVETELAPAEARARLAEAIDVGARTYPPYVTDQWPLCRPLVEWFCASMPTGGAGYEHREWTDADRAAIAAEFFQSGFAPHSGDPQAQAIVDDVLWYGTDYSNRDPFRWGIPKIEVFLLDWVPRKIVADVRYLLGIPALLKSFVEFAHAKSGIRPALTLEALEAVDGFLDEYLDIIGRSRA